MNLADHLSRHLELCERLYALMAEENHWLKHEQRPPDASWREQKRSLLEAWTASLNDLKSRPRQPGERGGADLEKARQRCLQILHLDRENEQLLLRCSLGPTTAPPATAARPSMSSVARAYQGQG